MSEINIQQTVDIQTTSTETPRHGDVMECINWVITHTPTNMKLSGQFAQSRGGDTAKHMRVMLRDFRTLIGYGDDDDYAMQFEKEGE
jgi:hypothetical protein